MFLNKVVINSEKFPLTTCYPFNLELIKQLKEIQFITPITFFIGENGCGKTTILRAIAQSCGVHIWEFSERSRYNFNKYEDSLHKFIEIQWIKDKVPGNYFDARNFEFFTKILDEWAVADKGQLQYFGGKSLVAQSHGQSLMSFFKSRYKIKGIYFLDEPETALSPSTQINLLKFLMEIAKEGHAQFVIATHSPILLALPGANIYQFTDEAISAIHYEDTFNYKLYKEFINNRDKFI
jgi:predicted ATPase